MQPFEIIPQILEAKEKKIQAERRKFAPTGNWASSLGHPCEFYLYASRVHWEDKQPIDAFTKMLFEAGDDIEQRALKDLIEGGHIVIEPQKYFQISYLKITGKLDCKILRDGYAYPIEIKGLEPYTWGKLNCVEDFLESKKHWVQGYPTQLTLYMLAENIEYGCFYIVNKLTRAPKEIWINLDYTFAEEILQKAERINKAVDTLTPPPRINDFDVCNRCGFLHVCLPEIQGTEIEFIDDTELEAILNRHQEIEATAKEYQKLDKQWKEMVKEKEKVSVGDYLIVGKLVKRAGYTVQDSEYWTSKLLMKPKGK